MYKWNLAVNNPQGLICKRTQPTKISCVFDIFFICDVLTLCLVMASA